jgi:DNA-binding CsgD family transcriptional regulator
LSNREIAEQLAFAESTVKKLLHQAFRKLGASNKGQAFRICLKLGVINVLDLYPLENLISCYVPPVPEKIILTHRERQMLALAGQALSNHEIAEKMGISMSAVKRCLSNIYAKLGAHSRVQAIWVAQWRGFLNNLEIISPEDVADIVAASGIHATRMYLALLEQKMGALGPEELCYEPYTSNLGKLKRFRDLLQERLTSLQGGARVPVSN